MSSIFNGVHFHVIRKSDDVLVAQGDTAGVGKLSLDLPAGTYKIIIVQPEGYVPNLMTVAVPAQGSFEATANIEETETPGVNAIIVTEDITIVEGGTTSFVVDFKNV